MWPRIASSSLLKTDKNGQYTAKDLAKRQVRRQAAAAAGFKTTIVKGVEVGEGKAVHGQHSTRSWQLGRMLRVRRATNEIARRFGPEYNSVERL